MLGLDRRKVELFLTQPEWEAAFERERDKIHAAAGDLVREIHHVGSTAIPGLVAKPIIDIALVLESMGQVGELTSMITPLGWLDRGEIKEGDHFFVLESEVDVRSHHLHVVEVNSSNLDEYLLFKAALLADATIVLRYAELKKQLKERFQEDRVAYTNSKEEFIQAVIDEYRKVATSDK